MRAPLSIAATLILATSLLAGCGGNNAVNAPGSPGGSSSADEAEIAATMAAAPEAIEDGEFEREDVSTVTGAQGTAAIRPLRFWRTIRDVDRRFEFAFADSDSAGRPTTAVVTIRKRLLGRFNILVGEPGSDGTLPDSALHVIHKPLEDHWVRHLLLKRVRVNEHERAVWKVVATSGVKVTSRDAVTRIESLRVQSGDLDTTITDPSRFLHLRRILRLEPGAEVMLTATTLAADDVVFLQLRDHRLRFRANGDNTYTGVWTVRALTGLRHFGVNALAHGTLFDDEAPYDSQAWLLPFVVRPDQVAEQLP